jgi:uncharacterized protein (TIGR02147 family)
VLKGKRTLSESTAMRVASVLKLGKKERDYFVSMIRYNQAGTPEEKEYFFEKMMRSVRPGNLKIVAVEQYDFYRKWHHSAVRELAALPGFKEDPVWIANALKPAIRHSEAAESIALLKRLGLLRYNKERRLVQSDPVLWQENPAHGDARTVFVRQFHRQMIGLAGEALERFAPADREVSSLTVSASKEALEHVRSRVVDFEKELLNYIEKDKRTSEAVYQMNFQLFPLSNTVSGKGRK